MTTHDPHLNAFYYYSGRRMAHTDRDQQIEDNTTKALINALQLSARYGSPDDLLRPFLTWIGVYRTGPDAVRFALQRETIGDGPIRRARQKVLLGIAPRVEQGEAGERPLGDRGSRPDAWIWGRNFVVVVETKIRGTFDARQLTAHERALGVSGVQRRLVTWSDAFAFLRRRLEALEAKDRKGAGAMLLDQRVHYLRIIAYQEDIAMEKFGGFATDVFDSFSAVEDEEAEDARKSALHALETFVRDLQKSLPRELLRFKHVTPGRIGASDRYVWVALSRLDRPVNEPHFSFVMTPEGFSMKLLLEGNTPTIAARRAIANGPDKFMTLLKELKGYELVLKRRWQKQAQSYFSTRACSIDLAAVGQEDVAYLLVKMAVLKRKGTESGFFEIYVQREFSRDMMVLRSKQFIATVVEELKKLAALDQFFTGARKYEKERKKK